MIHIRLYTLFQNDLSNSTVRLPGDRNHDEMISLLGETAVVQFMDAHLGVSGGGFLKTSTD